MTHATLMMEFRRESSGCYSAEGGGSFPEGKDFPLRGEDFRLSAKNRRYVRFLQNFAWWIPWTCPTTEKCKNPLLIDFKQRRPCISGISAEGWGFSAEGGDFPLRGEDFLLGGGGGVEICCSHILWSLTLCFWPDSESTKLLHHTQQKWPVKTIGVFVFVLHPWVHLTNKRKLKVDNHKIILNILYIEIKTFNAPGQFSRKNLILFLQFLPDFQCSNIFAVTWTYAEPIFLR